MSSHPFPLNTFPHDIWYQILIQVDDYHTFKKLLCLGKLFGNILSHGTFDKALFRRPAQAEQYSVGLSAKLNEEADLGEDGLQEIVRARQELHDSEKAMATYTLHPLLSDIAGNLGRHLDNTGPQTFLVRGENILNTCLRDECAVWPSNARVELVMEEKWYYMEASKSVPDALDSMRMAFMERLSTSFSVWTNGPEGFIGWRKLTTRISSKNKEVLQLEPIWAHQTRQPPPITTVFDSFPPFGASF